MSNNVDEINRKVEVLMALSTILMKEKADLGAIQEVLRHKSATTTARYLKRIGETKPTLKLVSQRTKGKFKNKSANRMLTKNGE